MLGKGKAMLGCGGEEMEEVKAHLLLFCVLSTAWHGAAGCHLLCAAIEKKLLVVLSLLVIVCY